MYLSIYVSVCMQLCLSVRLPCFKSRSICLTFRSPVIMFLFCLSVCFLLFMTICNYVSLVFVCLFPVIYDHLHLCLFIDFLSVRLAFSMFVCLSIRLFVCLSVCLSQRFKIRRCFGRLGSVRDSFSCFVKVTSKKLRMFFLKSAP